MDIWEELKKLAGYNSGDGGVDSYGVDHSGFSTRDELEYQNARLTRENQLAENFAKQGIAEENYPKYGTNFWGQTSENNYGFGTSNISQNVQDVTNRLNSMATQNNNEQQLNNNLQSSEQNNTSSTWDSVKDFTQNAVNAIAPYTPTYYAGYAVRTAQDTFNKLRDLYGAYEQNGATAAAQQYGEPSVKKAMKAADWISPLNISDVNKHQYVSCVGSTGGPLATAETLAGGVYKEYVDYNKKMNNQDLLNQYGGKWGVVGDGLKDLGNDIKGSWKGLWSDDPEECEELLPYQYRKKRYW